MGWFLTRQSGKSKRSSRRSTRRSAASPKPWDPTRTLIALKILGSIAVAVGLVVGWVHLERVLTDYARAEHVTVVNVDHVVLVGQPEWMSSPVQQELRRTVCDQLGTDPMDSSGLAQAVEVLSRNAWVKSVRQVSRGTDGSVHVDAEYRTPVAVVRGEHGYHLVDAEGVRLPGLYESLQVPRLPVPQIEGVRNPPPARSGEVWLGEDLRAGLELAMLIRYEPYAQQIKAIDVSQRDSKDRIRLVMHTEHQGQIAWGLPVGDEVSIEPDAELKLARLRRVVEAKGSVDAGGRLVKVYGATTQIERAPLHEQSISAMAQ